MLRPALRFSFLLAGLWIAIKLGFMAIDIFQKDIMVSSMINNFLLLLAIALGLYYEKKKEGFGVGSALSDIKHAMTAGAPYALIVSVFMYFYYDTINPSFIESGVQERMDMIYHDMERESYVDSLKMNNEDFKVLTNEEILRKAKEEIESNYAPKSMLVFSLLGLMIMAATYSILITLIYRKILFKDWYKGA